MEQGIASRLDGLLALLVHSIGLLAKVTNPTMQVPRGV
jgi:hypothetical protein